MISKTRLLVLGAGGHGRSVAEAAELSGMFKVVGFLDDLLLDGEKILGVPVLGSMDKICKLRSVADQAIVAVGNNYLRENLLRKLTELDFESATVIHSRAFVSPSASIGAGTVVMAGAIIGTEARLGVGTIVNCGATVDHNAIVKDFGHLGVNTCMAGGTVLGRGAWLQVGAALGYGVEVEDGEVISSCTGRNFNKA